MATVLAHRFEQKQLCFNDPVSAEIIDFCPGLRFEIDLGMYTSRCEGEESDDPLYRLNVWHRTAE